MDDAGCDPNDARTPLAITGGSVAARAATSALQPDDWSQHALVKLREKMATRCLRALHRQRVMDTRDTRSEHQSVVDGTLRGAITDAMEIPCTSSSTVNTMMMQSRTKHAISKEFSDRPAERARSAITSLPARPTRDLDAIVLSAGTSSDWSEVKET